MSNDHPTDIWYQDEPTTPHEAKVPGSGLGVWELVRDLIGMGSVDAVLAAFPHLTREAIQAALHYYADHTAEIDQRIRENASAFAEHRGRLPHLAGMDVDEIMDDLRGTGPDREPLPDTDLGFSDRPEPVEAWEIVRDILASGGVASLQQACPHLTRDSIVAALRQYADHFEDVEWEIDRDRCARVAQLAGGAEILTELAEVLTPREVGQWFGIPARLLKGRRPIDVLAEGDITAVRAAIKAFMESHCG